MNGIYTHTKTVDDKTKQRLEELAPTLQAIKWIDKNLGSYEGYIERVVEILHTRIETYAWVGYYWVQPSGLTLIASRGIKAGEHRHVGIRMGLFGRAAVMGHTLTEASRGIIKSEIGVPVERSGVVTGLIAVKSEQVKAFNLEHVQFLENVAVEVGMRFLR
jgi:putative methionine-R-sulfoxide reductase with GAF domain